MIDQHRLKNIIDNAFLLEDRAEKQFVYNDKVYESISTPLFTNDNMFLGCLILIHDITAIKYAERMQKAFIADASHELKTPISGIKGIVEVLIRDKDMDEDIRIDFLETIDKENERMNSEVNNNE